MHQYSEAFLTIQTDSQSHHLYKHVILTKMGSKLTCNPLLPPSFLPFWLLLMKLLLAGPAKESHLSISSHNRTTRQDTTMVLAAEMKNESACL